jgi:hypothetical protein
MSTDEAAGEAYVTQLGLHLCLNALHIGDSVLLLLNAEFCLLHSLLTDCQFLKQLAELRGQARNLAFEFNRLIFSLLDPLFCSQSLYYVSTRQ